MAGLWWSVKCARCYLHANGGKHCVIFFGFSVLRGSRSAEAHKMAGCTRGGAALNVEAVSFACVST